MNTNDKATARPWQIHSNEFCSWISNQLGKAQIARVFKPAGMTEETAQANAALIVQAVNEHSALNAVAEAADLLLQATFAGATPQERAMYNEVLEERLAELARMRESGVAK